MKINILGTEWTIEYRNANTDLLLKENDGYTDPSVKLIVVANEREGCTNQDYKCMQRENLRHEIIHAFCSRVGWASILSITSLGMKKL